MRDMNSALVLIIMRDVESFVVVASKWLGTSRTMGRRLARKVKARLRMLQHAQRVSGNVSQTCRFFGVSRALFYIWKKRFDNNGLAGLRDRPHLALKGKTPTERVRELVRPSNSVRDLS